MKQNGTVQFPDPQYLWCGDAWLAAYEWGAGEPLVLLHGNGEDSRYFAACIPYLSRFYRVIAIDSRGHGRSERGGGPLDFGRMTADLCMCLDALGVWKTHLLGFSDGGNLAIKFALSHPQRVDKLILNGANVSMLHGVVPWVQLPLYPAVGLLSLCAPLSAQAAEKRDVLALMTRDYGVRLEDLACIDARTLVIVGARDMITWAHTCNIVHALPDAALAVLPGTHFIAGETPARFCLNCLRFLRGEPVPDRKIV